VSPVERLIPSIRRILRARTNKAQIKKMNGWGAMTVQVFNASPVAAHWPERAGRVARAAMNVLVFCGTRLVESVAWAARHPSPFSCFILKLSRRAESISRAEPWLRRPAGSGADYLARCNAQADISSTRLKEKNS